MLLINLSSTNESSPSKFQNQFTDNLVIPPHSTISLVRVSLVRNGTQLNFTVPAGTMISYRTSPYDIFTAEINTVDVRYTAQTFTDRLNQLLNGLVAFRYEIKAGLIKHDDYNFTVSISSFNNADKWASTNLNSFIWGDTSTYQSNAKQCRLFGGADADLPIIAKNNSELQGARFNTNNCGFGAGWGDNITPINGQVQSRTFNHFTSSSSAFSMFNISSGFTNGNGLRFTVSYATTLEPPDDDVYATGGGVPGMIGWGNNHPVILKIGESGGNVLSGKLSLELKDHVNDQMDVINAGGTEYFIGDQINFLLEGGQTTPAAYDADHLFAPILRIRSNFGLVLWSGNCISDTQYYNNYGTTAVSNRNFWDTTTGEPQTQALYNPQRGYGVRMVRGFKTENLQQIEMDYQSQINPVTTEQIQTFTDVGQVWNNAVFFAAYSLTAGITDTADLGQYQLLDSNGINLRHMPTFISFVMILADKSSHTGQTQRGVLGGTVHPQILRFDTAGGGSNDVRVLEHDGTTHTANLQDGGGIRITWAFDQPYLVQIASYAGASTDLDIIVRDLSTNTNFTTTITLTAGGLGGLHQIGCNNPAQTNNQHYLHGYIADFRIYQKPQTQGANNTLWDNLKTDSQEYYTSGVWNARTGGFYATTTEINLYTAGEFKYCNWGSETPTGGTCTPFLAYDGNPDVADNTWYNTTNIHFYPCIRQPNSTRNQTLGLASVYAGRGQGVVASNPLNELVDFIDYDETNQTVLEIEDENGLDSEENPIAIIGTDQEEVDIDDKIFNIEIKNLPHRTYNGTTGNFDKTIYQIGSLLEGKTIEGDRFIEHYPKEKIEIPLNNAGDIILNQIDVQISDEFGIQETDLRGSTNLTVEIK